MRIQEVRVNRYGPLSNIVLEKVSNFTLIFGENESGKTLFLDAILRFLLSGVRERQLFSKLDRVEHDPDGFIDIAHKEKTLRFPNDGSLPDVLEVNAEDLRNVLVVQASDLQLPEGKEPDYYSFVTDRLMGIHREPIRAIRKRLKDIGQLTRDDSAGSLSDDKGYGKIKSKIKDTKTILDRIGAHLQETDDFDLVVLETDLLNNKERREQLEKDLDELRQAKKREEYHSSKLAVDELEMCIKNIVELPDVDQSHYDDWRDANNAIKYAREDLDQAEAELSERKYELKERRGDLEEKQRILGELSYKMPSVEGLQTEAERQAIRLKDEAGFGRVQELLPRGVFILSALLGLSLLGLILNPQVSLFRNLSIIGGIGFALSAISLIVVRAMEGRKDRDWENMRLESAKHDFDVDTLEELLAAIEGFRRDIEMAREAVREARSQRDVAASLMEETEKKTDELRVRIRSTEQAIDDLKEKTGLTSFKALVKALANLTTFEKRRAELITRLEERFNEAGSPIEDQRVAWKKEIADLKQFGDVAKGVEYDEVEANNYVEQINTLDREIEELEEKLEEYNQEISKIVEEANRILSPEVSFPGDTFEDIELIRREMRAFVESVEERADLALTAIRIFEQIEESEEEKVKDLFGEGDRASEYFRTITNGAYSSIEYEPGDGELYVIRSNGDRLRAYQLSTGTYDQLYLATRLSLAQQILQEERGFLLLDDPFLTSDSKRLPRQLEIIQQFADKGWQVIYFSVKDEVKSALKNSIKNGRIDLKVLPSIHE